MFNLWQNPCILTARAQNKDWGSDLSTPSELLREKSWLLKDVYIRQPGSFFLDSIFLYIIIYQNTPVRIYLGECPRGYTKLFLLPFPTGKVKAVTPLPWSMTFSACQVPVEFYLIFGHTVMVDFSSFFPQSGVSLMYYKGTEGSHSNVILWIFQWKIVDYLTFTCKLIYPSAALKSLGLFQIWVIPKVCNL